MTNLLSISAALLATTASAQHFTGFTLNETDPCIPDGVCAGNDMTVCCSQRNHKTLRCGPGDDGCHACTNTVTWLENKAAQECDPSVICGRLSGIEASICQIIVAKSCPYVINKIEAAWPPERICDSLGFCGAGYRCGCIPDGSCTDAAAQCCTGKSHSTLKYGATIAGNGGRCGCLPKGACSVLPDECCSGGLTKHFKCGAFGGMCQ